jgi:ribosomal protein L11 methylase PrmA
MLRKLSPNGKILFSGLLVSDQEIISNALAVRNFKVITVIKENEWIALTAERK